MLQYFHFFRSVRWNEAGIRQWRVIVGTTRTARNVRNAASTLVNDGWSFKRSRWEWLSNGRAGNDDGRTTTPDASHATGAVSPSSSGSPASTATTAAGSRGNAWRGHVSRCRGNDATPSSSSACPPTSRGNASRLPAESYDSTKHAPWAYANVGILYNL